MGREAATTWATCFRALGDPSRVLILHLLATSRRPLTVGEITDALDIGQSTVSHHLRKLAEVRFVRVHHEGNSSFYRVNDDCLTDLPTAVDVVMGTAPARSLATRGEPNR